MDMPSWLLIADEKLRLLGIVSSCISNALKEDIYEKIRSTPFSLGLGESSDIYGSSYLAVSTKLLETKTSKTSNSQANYNNTHGTAKYRTCNI